MVDVCDYLMDLFEQNTAELGLAALYYGDQQKIPLTPALCLEPDEKPRELKGAQRMTRVSFRIHMILYYSHVGSIQDNRRQADKLADAIETLVHTKPTLDGLVIHGMCTDTVSGYVTKDRSMIRASRVTYEALSQKLLPGSG
jgi:hypothetical protein